VMERRSRPLGREASTRIRRALASLAVGIIGFRVGTYDIAVQSRDIDSYGGGSAPLSYRIMWFIVLPCGIAGIGLGTLALALLALDDSPGTSDAARTRTRRAAWCGIAVSALVVILSLVGAFLIFLGMAGPD
jgi:uncharacterized membrane protein YidH (DUF202 family)